MSKPDLSAKSEVIQQYLEGSSQALEQVSGFVQRQSKLQGAMFAKPLILGWLSNGSASLNELRQVSEELEVRISASGLAQWMNTGAVTFMHATSRVRTIEE